MTALFVLVTMAGVMKIIFAGTPNFVLSTLEVLIDSDHEIVAVLTQPDRPAGRGRHLVASPVKQRAEQAGLTIMQPDTLRSDTIQDDIRTLKPDVMVIVGYGLLLPKAVLDIPKYGCVNIHPSLLPRWRGAAPVQHTLLAGDTETGVCVVAMDVGMDSGPIYKTHKMTLKGDETTGDLYPHLFHLGAEMLLSVLHEIESGTAKPQVQSSEGVTLAPKINKAEAQLNWEQSAVQLDACIRAYNPVPMAYTHWGERRVRIGFARAISETAEAAPGIVAGLSEAGIDVATGDRVLRILQLQLPGGKMISSADFFHAHSHEIKVGETRFVME